MPARFPVDRPRECDRACRVEGEAYPRWLPREHSGSYLAPAHPRQAPASHSHSSVRWAVLFLSCLIPNWAGSTGVVLREQEIGEGGGEEQPGSDWSGSEFKTVEATEGRKKERAARASRRRTQRAVARSYTCLPTAPLCPALLPPRSALLCSGRRASACVGGRGRAGPAKGWRKSLMSCAAH